VYDDVDEDGSRYGKNGALTLSATQPTICSILDEARFTRIISVERGAA